MVRVRSKSAHLTGKGEGEVYRVVMLVVVRVWCTRIVMVISCGEGGSPGREEALSDDAKPRRPEETYM